MAAEKTEAAGVPYAYRFPAWAWVLLGFLAAAVYLAFEQAIVFMVGQWNMDEFSHGYLIPFISAFLIWQRRNELQQLEFRGSWTGMLVVLAGVLLEVAGRLSALYAVQHVALLLMIVGLVLALVGNNAMRLLAMPLAILVFMIPLPNILLNTLSSELQLISSSLGVELIRWAGVSVFLQGNVIDLGAYKLEVAEACSGLRYLLPLMTLAFLIAYFYRAAFWKRTVVFLSSIPVTLLMNSLRIGIIGVTVDRWGISMAEGVLHQVQGWMMFMMSTGLLVLEVIMLSRVGDDGHHSWRQVFSLELPQSLPRELPRRPRALPIPLLVAGFVVVAFSAAALAMPAQVLTVPVRESFESFPLQLGGWDGRREVMDSVYLDALKLDDYLLANYINGESIPVNFYVAWYDSQTAGEATHSPKACLPGGGWRITDLRQVDVNGVNVGSQALRVNRALIEFGDQRELVYYWFQQRGRVVTNEYLVKWYLLVDGLLRHRTDGALIRIIVPVDHDHTVEQAEASLHSFTSVIAARLTSFVPS